MKTVRIGDALLALGGDRGEEGEVGDEITDQKST